MRLIILLVILPFLFGIFVAIHNGRSEEVIKRNNEEAVPRRSTLAVEKNVRRSRNRKVVSTIRLTDNLFNKEYWFSNYTIPAVVQEKISKAAASLMLMEKLDTTGRYTGKRNSVTVPQSNIIHEVSSSDLFTQGIRHLVGDASLQLSLTEPLTLVHFPPSHHTTGLSKPTPVYPRDPITVLFIVTNANSPFLIKTRNGVVSVVPKDFSIVAVSSSEGYAVPTVDTDSDLVFIEMVYTRAQSGLFDVPQATSSSDFEGSLTSVADLTTL
eukprot:TRINITY_DN475_c4_g1_i1.p1 TRINITY_DN475_c4_g1~~TRINITY_DN475_c4_g1_i1.p1  ORF type:complete len:268 (+),score=24.13 TRINITY_DN475_c4_g1_i1:95-898(+)